MNIYIYIYIYIYIKYNHKLKSQVILLMATDDGERWPYLAVRSLPALLRGIPSSNNGEVSLVLLFQLFSLISHT